MAQLYHPNDFLTRIRVLNLIRIRARCVDRGHSFYRDGTDMTDFCFGEPEHAEQFRERFGGGEIIDPKERPKWPGSRR